MNARWLKIKKLLAEKNANVFWLPNHERSGQPGTRYLSGFTGSDSHLFVTKNKAYLMTDGRYLVATRKEVTECVVVDVAKQSPSEFLKKILPKMEKKTILIDGAVTHFSAVEKIKEKIPGVKIINSDGLLKELRRVKTVAELKLLKKAADISCKAFEGFLPFIKIGVTEKWLARKLTDLLLDFGADDISFEPIIASGENSALPHARPTDKKLKKGELVIIDFGANFKGYVSDMTRTVAVGNISPKLRNMYEVVREAQEKGCAKARAGRRGLTPARALDSACRETLKKHGLEKYFTHATGHGIGLEVHELPVISSTQNNPLETGEVITCEPGVYIKGLGGVRIEDSLVITKSGVTNLTQKITKNLITL